MFEIAKLQQDIPAAGILPTPLKDVMTHPQLYQDFPETGGITTMMQASLDQGYGGLYYPPTSSSPRGAIRVSNLYDRNPGKEAGVLLHEGQHGIAHLTGALPTGQHWQKLDREVKDLQEITNRYANSGADDAAALESRLAELESEAPDSYVFQKLTDPIYGEIGVLQEAARAPSKALTDVLYGPEGLTKGFRSQDPARSLYYRDPGEAIARLAAARRELSMAERRETTPMETLRQEERPLEWDELAKIRSAYDLRDYLTEQYGVDLGRPMVDRGGMQRYTTTDYAKALNLALDDLPDLVAEITNKADLAPDYETQRQVFSEGLGRVRQLIEGKLKGFQ